MERKDRKQPKPSGYEQRAWHIRRMANIVEADAQRQRRRNRAFTGLPSGIVTQALFVNGEVKTRKIIIHTDDTKGA